MIAIVVFVLLAPAAISADPRPVAADVRRIRTALERLQPAPRFQVTPPSVASLSPQMRRTQRAASGSPDPLWNGVFIGAGIGAAAGYGWGRSRCDNDDECEIRAVPVGIIAGAAIGAAAGAVVDRLIR